MGDFRWLIEAPGPRYLATRRFSTFAELTWTADHDKALCFKNHEQADALMLSVRDLKPDLFGFEKTLGNARAVEHGWMDGVADRAKAAVEQVGSDARVDPDMLRKPTTI